MKTQLQAMLTEEQSQTLSAQLKQHLDLLDPHSDSLKGQTEALEKAVDDISASKFQKLAKLPGSPGVPAIEDVI